MRRVVTSVLLTAGLLVAPVAAGAASAAAPPEGGRWFETFIETNDGETLHVDVIRGIDVADDTKQPVILVASPYLGLESPDETPGPSNRFFDLIEGADLLDDYTVVMVSLRGSGGSSGCLDILGPGEQEDVRAGVEYAVNADFSTGNVGMYGKSYDANTGALALATRPEGLDAVVAQQIAPDRYRGSYSDRVRLAQSILYPSATYGSGAEGGFSVSSDPTSIQNSLANSADCQVPLAEHYVDDESTAFWRSRDFVDGAEGSTIPAIITTGYLDNATNIGAGAVDLFNALDGPKQLWIGWWDHVRGNDTVGDEGRLAMGRADFFGTVRRFFDHHVAGVPLADAATDKDPVVAAQTSDGTWRQESTFPSSDTGTVVGPLLAGTYTDDGANQGSSDTSSGAGGLITLDSSPGNGAWTFSAPVTTDVHLAGIPSAVIDVAPSVPSTNVVVNLYDVDTEGNATMISRGAALADGAGEKPIEMFPTDWIVASGHRLGVLVSGSNVEAWTHVPTMTPVTVNGGSVTLPVLPADHVVRTLAGSPAPRLEDYLVDAPFLVDAATIESGTNASFVLAPASAPAPAPQPSTTAAPAPATSAAQPAPAATTPSAAPAPTTPSSGPLPATGGGLALLGLAAALAATRRRR